MARPTVRERLIAMGLFERIVAIYASSRNKTGGPLGEIPAGSAPAWKAIAAAFRETGLTSPQAKQALWDIQEQARLAHNAAWRFNKQNRPSVGGVNTLPCRDSNGERCTGQIGVDAIVTIRDPETGQEYSTLVRARFDTPPNRQQLQAALLAMAADRSDSGASGRGMVSPGQGTQLSRYVVTGLYGVNN